MKLLPKYNTHAHSLIFMALVLLLCAGCKTENTLPTEVARVNGESILYQDLETRRSTLTGVFADSTEKTNTTLANWQYRRALQQLITEKLVAQYLAKKKLTLANDAVRNFEDSVRQDYGKYDFESILAEQGLTLDEWRKNIRGMLLVDLFKTEVLRPSISISSEEIELYYNAHKHDFSFSEQWRFLQISALNKIIVEEAKEDLLQNKNPFATKSKFNVSIRDINVEKERLPEKYSNILAPLKPWQASQVIEYEDEFICLLLLDKTPPVTLDLLATYDRVEHLITETKLEAAYNVWLNDMVAKSNIFIHPVLLQNIGDIPDDFPVVDEPGDQDTEEDTKDLPAEP